MMMMMMIDDNDDDVVVMEGDSNYGHDLDDVYYDYEN